MIYFNNVETLEELRKQYKELLKKYHPDNTGGSTEATQTINAEYTELFKMLKDRHDKQENGSNTSYDNMKYDFSEDQKLRDALEKVIALQGIIIEIVGCWIWVTGNTYQYRKYLKESGFHFAGQKKAWYFHTEAFRKKSSKTLSMNDIRNYYGSTEVHTKAVAAIEA